MRHVARHVESWRGLSAGRSIILPSLRARAPASYRPLRADPTAGPPDQPKLITRHHQQAEHARRIPAKSPLQNLGYQAFAQIARLEN